MFLFFNIISNKNIQNYLFNIIKFLDRSCNRFKQIVRLHECEKLQNQSRTPDAPKGNESNKTTETDHQSVALIINSVILFKINDASINIPKLITNNKLNQSKQTRNQNQQNLIQPHVVYDQSNNENIQFLPQPSAI